MLNNENLTELVRFLLFHAAAHRIADPKARGKSMEQKRLNLYLIDMKYTRKYCVPLSSPKPKSMKNDIDFMRIMGGTGRADTERTLID